MRFIRPPAGYLSAKCIAFVDISKISNNSSTVILFLPYSILFPFRSLYHLLFTCIRRSVRPIPFLFVLILRSPSYAFTRLIIGLAWYILHIRSRRLHFQISFLPPYVAFPIATVLLFTGTRRLEVNLLFISPFVFYTFLDLSFLVHIGVEIQFMLIVRIPISKYKAKSFYVDIS